MNRVLPILALLAAFAVAPRPASAALTLDTLEPRPREMLLASLRFSDGYWDETAGLLRSPAPGEPQLHRVRESTWYALGLFLRNQPGDEARAVRILNLVLSHQFDAPGQPWDGTFRRAPEEPLPGPGAELWKNYDPNWRQFIGSTFALILIEFESRLPAGLPARIEASIRRAVEGELTQGRAEPYHTNIKLMHGFLWSWAGRRFGRRDWVAGGERWAEEVAAAFVAHETFDEYNSPTYYGVDLYGLALWRRHGVTEKIRTLGAKLETGLWRDIGRFYHAGLGNLCGPFDRAYGMDMRRYVSLTGAWMGLVLPAELTPMPDPAGPMQHAHDFVCVPAYVVLGAQVPEDVLPAFRGFQGERRLERIISPERTATAWISRDLMLGGEVTGRKREAGPGTRYGQFHPATGHWRVGAADVGWFALKQCPPVDARAEPGRLTIATARGDSVFRLAAPGLDPTKLTRDHWSPPNLDVRIETDATGFNVAVVKGEVELTYSGTTHFVMQIARQP